MGIYLNPGNEGFRTTRNSVYVDKSGLISLINETLDTKAKLSCVSRPRRFGKSTAAQMLCAYYDRSCDSASLFEGLAIADDPSFRTHLNHYDVIYLDITHIIGNQGPEQVVSYIRKALVRELKAAYPAAEYSEELDIMMANVVSLTGSKLFAIIDEWDALIRDSRSTPALQKEYLDFLRSLFKSSGTTDKIFIGAYMTGILPVKKDGSQSAISEFREYTMISPKRFAPYTGFLESEVQDLCRRYHVSFADMKRWYDGYSFPDIPSVYNPSSVMEAIRNRSFESYWQQSSAADSLLTYVNMNYDGLSETVTRLLGGSRIPIDINGFQNDLCSFASGDDVLTLLIHFGYLSYDGGTGTAVIPNEEIHMEFARIVRRVTHVETIRRIHESDDLLKDMLNLNEDAVAARLERVHREEFTPLFYNNEQSLRSVIKLAFFTYRDHYIQLEELPSGTGYADLLYLPKPDTQYPALLIELKWKDSPEAAIAQIRSRRYPDVLTDYGSPVLLVGVSYDKEDPEKKHRCRIELLSDF